MLSTLILFSAVITAQPLVNADVLEPSVQNEVDHALSLVPTNAFALASATLAFTTLYETNGMNATERAISLVSSQKDGRWMHNGQDVTFAAVLMLRELSNPAPCAERPCCGTNACMRVTK